MTSLRARLYRLHWKARAGGGGPGLPEAIRFLAQSARWDRRRLDELRDLKLARLVARAYQGSPRYRALMDEQGVRPADVQGLADLPRLPVLTKDELRANLAGLRIRSDLPVETGSTGGTTGNPITVVRDLPGSVWQRGCYWRGFGWGGLRLGEPFVQLFGGTLGVSAQRPLNQLKSWFAGKTFLPAYELGPHNAVAYLDRIRGSGARYLVGYASSAYLLACHAERAGFQVSLDAVFPTAETLPDAWRDTIARVFGAAVLPYYGSGEVQSLGYSCPESPDHAYHTCDEHSVIEVERPGGGAALTGEGPFLVTDLDNLALPLLRYRNGDAGALAPAGCRCGLTLGVIRRIDGRVNDVLYTTAGHPISGTIGAHLFKLVPGVEQFQIHQRLPGQVTIRIVRAPSYQAAAAEPTIHHALRRHLGQEASIELQYVEELPRTAAGKARFIISEVPAPGRG